MSDIALHLIVIGAVQMGGWKRIRIRQRLSLLVHCRSFFQCVLLLLKERSKNILELKLYRPLTTDRPHQNFLFISYVVLFLTVTTKYSCDRLATPVAVSHAVYRYADCGTALKPLCRLFASRGLQASSKNVFG